MLVNTHTYSYSFMDECSVCSDMRASMISDTYKNMYYTHIHTCTHIFKTCIHVHMRTIQKKKVKNEKENKKSSV